MSWRIILIHFKNVSCSKVKMKKRPYHICNRAYKVSLHFEIDTFLNGSKYPSTTMVVDQWLKVLQLDIKKLATGSDRIHNRKLLKQRVNNLKTNQKTLATASAVKGLEFWLFWWNLLFDIFYFCKSYKRNHYFSHCEVGASGFCFNSYLGIIKIISWYFFISSESLLLLIAPIKKT